MSSNLSPSNIRSQTQPPTNVVVGRMLALMAGATVAAWAGVDADLWGHLRFGLDLLRDGHLTAIDPYSFTQDIPWINHEWLSEVVLALAYRAGGVTGMLLLKTAILGTAFYLLAGVARQAENQYRWWLLTVSIVGVLTAAGTFRPQIWTVLGLAILCNCLSRRASLLWLPVVFAVWANMHGGWVVGIGVAGLWLVGRIVDTRDLWGQRREALLLMLSVLATLINPYGWGLWRFLLATVRVGRDISEWRPLWEGADVHFGALWPVTIGVLAVSVIYRWRRLSWATALPVAWLALNGLLVARLAALFNEISIFALAPLWASSFLPATEAHEPPMRTYAFVDITIVAAVWLTSAVGTSRCLPITAVWAPDLAAAGAITASSLEGRMITPFNWGEYSIWQWGPRLKVSMDGRRETIYSDATLALQAAVANGKPEGFAYLAHVRPEYVWLALPSSASTEVWLANNGYRIDIKTKDSFVAARIDRPVLSHGTPMPACFP
jgi:hypothetical protein